MEALNIANQKEEYSMGYISWNRNTNEIKYPVLVRPSYVLGGQGMKSVTMSTIW